MPTEPIQNWGLHGHAEQLALLERAMATGRLAHAYIFSGPAQVGKRSAARRLAAFLLCDAGTACGSCANCKSLSGGAHADYIEIDPAGEPVKIEAIRDLAYRLSLRPYSARRKVAVIDDAHLMTAEAANALLKALEEPKPDTHIILITDNHHRLLPTISSRAQKLSFGPVDEKLFALWAASRGLPDPDPAFAGRPGHALALARDQAVAEAAAADARALDGFLAGTLGRRLLLAQELAEREAPELKATLERWLHHLHHRLVKAPDPAMARKTRAVTRALKMLDQNANPKLFLSELMLAQ